MIRWLIRKIWGCSEQCKFAPYGECISVYSQFSDKTPVNFIYVLRCETCGRMKNHKA